MRRFPASGPAATLTAPRLVVIVTVVSGVVTSASLMSFHVATGLPLTETMVSPGAIALPSCLGLSDENVRPDVSVSEFAPQQ